MTKVAVKVIGRNAWRGEHWGDLGKQTYGVWRYLVTPSPNPELHTSLFHHI